MYMVAAYSTPSQPLGLTLGCAIICNRIHMKHIFQILENILRIPFHFSEGL